MMIEIYGKRINTLPMGHEALEEQFVYSCKRYREKFFRCIEAPNNGTDVQKSECRIYQGVMEGLGLAIGLSSYQMDEIMYSLMNSAWEEYRS